MLRRRDIGAAPQRRADETWLAIVALIADTLDRSDSIDRADVITALAPADAVGPRLVAGRHLEERPVVLDADPVHLSIYTVSGAEALQIAENLAPVPGGASASVWKVYVPAPEPLRAEVTEAATRSAHLSAEDPPVGVVTAAAENGSLIDFGALAQRLKEGER